MFRSLSLFGLMATFSFSVMADGPRTVIEVTAPPTPKQVRTALNILQEALTAKDEEQIYEQKISRARNYLENRLVKRTFAAEILCDGKNAFDEDTSCDFSSISEEEVCYNGKIDVATNLIRLALTANHWNWDEEWVENPRIRSGKILVDLVDGPNEYSDTVEIPACE
ncbi:MAG: hypothetical protein HY391_04415 [Deltaproteobacteria bacterium]|nr:hypothetical protein [Deltaproteobacteria bacterium]